METIGITSSSSDDDIFNLGAQQPSTLIPTDDDHDDQQMMIMPSDYGDDNHDHLIMNNTTTTQCGSRFNGVWGDNDIGTFTPTGIAASRETIMNNTGANSSSSPLPLLFSPLPPQTPNLDTIDWVSLLSPCDGGLEPSGISVGSSSSSVPPANSSSIGQDQTMGDRVNAMINNGVRRGENNNGKGRVEGSTYHNSSYSSGHSMKKKAVPPRFAFHTRSAEDVLDDGYKWRKYGQKSVKNSVHPR